MLTVDMMIDAASLAAEALSERVAARCGAAWGNALVRDKRCYHALMHRCVDAQHRACYTVGQDEHRQG